MAAAAQMLVLLERLPAALLAMAAALGALAALPARRAGRRRAACASRHCMPLHALLPC